MEAFVHRIIRVGYIRCTNVIAMPNDVADCERNVISRGRGSSLKVETKVEIKETFIRSVWSDRRSDRKEMNAEKMFRDFFRILVSFQNSRFLRRLSRFFLLLRSYICKSIYIFFCSRCWMFRGQCIGTSKTRNTIYRNYIQVFR